MSASPTNGTASFPQLPRTKTCVVTAAKTVETDTSSMVLLTTAGQYGSQITHLGVVPRATVTATRMNLMLSKDSGATQTVIGHCLVTAATINSTSLPPLTAFTRTDGTAISVTDPLNLDPGGSNADQLYVSAAVALAAGLAIAAQQQDF